MGGFLFKRKNKKDNPDAARIYDNYKIDNGIYSLKQGECGIIKKIEISGNAAARLNSLGVTVGKKITVLSFSLFKSSVLIGCGAVRLGLRKSLATKIGVEKCGG